MLTPKFALLETDNSTDRMYSASVQKIWQGGGLFSIIEIESKEDLDLSRIGALIEDLVVDLVMNSVEEDRVKIVKGVIDGVFHQFDEYRKSESIDEDNLTLRLGIALVLDSVLYFGRLRNTSCYLRRDHNVIDLGKSGESKVISGKLSEGDIILLSFDNNINKDLLLRERINASSIKGLLIGTDIDPAKIISEEPDSIIVESDEELEKSEIEPKKDATHKEVEDFKYPEPEVKDDPDKPEREDVVLKPNNVVLLLKNVWGFLRPKLIVAFKAILALGGNIFSWVWDTIVGPKKRGNYQMPGENSYKNRRILLLVIIVVLSLGLYISIRFVKESNYNRQIQEDYDELYMEIDSLLIDAESKISYSKEGALSDIETALPKIQELSAIEIEGNNYIELENKVTTIRDLIENRVRLSDPRVVSDIKIWYENAEPVDIVIYNGELWVSDQDNVCIYRISMDGESTKIALDRSSGLQSPTVLEVINDTLYVFDTKKGVMSYTEETGLKEVVGLTVSALGNVTEMSSFDSALYFIAEGSNRLLKASPAGSGFGYPQLRLEDDVFSSSLDLEINGLIYASGSYGLTRFYVNTKDEQIGFSDIYPSIESLGKIELLSSLKLILLDNLNKRVIILSQPQGNSSLFKLENQITVMEGEERYFNDLREIVVDPSTNVAYLLDSFRVLEIALDE